MDENIEVQRSILPWVHKSTKASLKPYFYQSSYPQPRTTAREVQDVKMMDLVEYVEICTVTQGLIHFLDAPEGPLAE